MSLTQPPRRVEFSLLNCRRCFVWWRNSYCRRDLRVTADRTSGPVDAHGRADRLDVRRPPPPKKKNFKFSAGWCQGGYLRRKFIVSHEEFGVFFPVYAISDCEHVHHGGKGGQLVCWWGWAILPVGCKEAAVQVTWAARLDCHKKNPGRGRTQWAVVLPPARAHAASTDVQGEGLLHTCMVS